MLLRYELIGYYKNVTNNLQIDYQNSQIISQHDITTIKPWVPFLHTTFEYLKL